MRVHISVYSLVRWSFDHPFVFFFFSSFHRMNCSHVCKCFISLFQSPRINLSSHINTSSAQLIGAAELSLIEIKRNACCADCTNKTGGIRRVRLINRLIRSHVKCSKQNRKKSILMLRTICMQGVHAHINWFSQRCKPIHLLLWMWFKHQFIECYLKVFSLVLIGTCAKKKSQQKAYCSWYARRIVKSIKGDKCRIANEKRGDGKNKSQKITGL